MSARAAERGLTLIEVALAVAILAIGLVGLIGAAGRALSVVRIAANYATAQELFERVRVERPLTFENGQPSDDESGTFDPPYEGWAWHRKTEPFTEREGETLFRATTRISWSERGRESHEEFVELIFAPAAEAARRSTPASAEGA